MNYRSDIDGLRSVAVLSVIISHASPGLMPGGFLGVDVFFVISGFLIATLVARDVQAGSFSAGTFYARRIRRLIPAFFVAMLATMLAGMFLMLPAELERTGLSIIAAVTSLSNYYFAMTSGYFAPDAALEPAIHTWSLAVEEQYYLVFPALLVLFYRRSQAFLIALLAAIAAASFFEAVRATGTNSNFAYFALWTRAWELLAGALLALAPWTTSVDRLDRRARNAVAMACAISLAVCFAAFDKTVAHPGYATLVPVIATLGLIATGQGGTIVSRILSLRPFVFVGLISYSAYLWHQPIIAFYKTIFGDASILAAAGLVTASLVAGYASWALVEKPTRHLRLSNGRTYIAFVLSVVVLGAVAFKILDTNGLPDRLPATAVRIASFETKETGTARACNVDDAKTFSEGDLCRHANENPSVILWGDSHGLSLAAGLLRNDPNFAFTQAAVSGCKIAIKHKNPKWKNGCADTEKKIYEMILNDTSITDVIFAGRWSTSGSTFIDLAGEKPVDGAVRQELIDIITAVADAGKNVVIVDPVPEFPWSVPETAARKEWFDGPGRVPLSMTTPEFDDRHEEIHHDFSRLEQHPDITRIKVRDLFCDDRSATCIAEKDGLPLYYDDDHLNAYGAAPIAARVINAVRAKQVHNGDQASR